MPTSQFVSPQWFHRAVVLEADQWRSGVQAKRGLRYRPSSEVPTIMPQGEGIPAAEARGSASLFNSVGTAVPLVLRTQSIASRKRSLLVSQQCGPRIAFSLLMTVPSPLIPGPERCRVEGHFDVVVANRCGRGRERCPALCALQL
jgi:hypothetical protein